MDAEGIRDMAYKFMRKMKLDQIDAMHTNDIVEKAHVIESFIARKGDDTFIEGAWVVGVHIPKAEDWAKVEAGEWNGFSVEALVQKETRDVEIDIPPVITGRTYKSEDKSHEHTFYVSYSEDGKFLGGVTDRVDGHIHKILRGTHTENADGHMHRFSHVDEILLTELPTQ
jgi:hypothetical protein